MLLTQGREVPKFSLMLFANSLISWWFLLFRLKTARHPSWSQIPPNMVHCSSIPHFDSFILKGRVEKGTTCWYVHLKYSWEHWSLQEFYIRFPTCTLESLLQPNFPYIKKTYTSETYLTVMSAVCWVDSFTVFNVQFWLVHEWLILFKMENHAVGKWKVYVSGCPFPGISHRSILLIATSQKLHSYQDWKINWTWCGHHTFFLLKQKTKQNKTKNSNLSFNSD